MLCSSNSLVPPGAVKIKIWDITAMMMMMMMMATMIRARSECMHDAVLLTVRVAFAGRPPKEAGRISEPVVQCKSTMRASSASLCFVLVVMATAIQPAAGGCVSVPVYIA